MALLEDMLKGGNIVNGLLIGAAFGLATRVVGPALVGTSGSVLRPAVKTAIKGGIIVWDYGRRLANEVTEQTSDVVSEARHEREAQMTSRATPEEAKASPRTTKSSTGGTVNEVPDATPV